MTERARTDIELIAAYRDGAETGAIVELYKRYENLVYSVCMRVLRSSADAEDAAASCFMVLVRKGAGLADARNLSGWLYSCAVRVAKVALRARQRRAYREREAQKMLESTQSSNHGNILLGQLEAHLAELPAKQRDPIVMQYYEGLSVDQIAERLSWPRGTVATRIKTGLERLRGKFSAAGQRLTGEEVAGALAAPGILLNAPGGLGAKVLAIAGGQAVSDTIVAIADAAMRGMLFARVKMVAAVAASVVIVGGGVIAAAQIAGGQGKENGTGTAPAGGQTVEKDSEGRIKAKDHAGREWLLQDWKEGAAGFPAPEDPAKYMEWLKNVMRPYPKDLKAREEWYRKKNGENWDGPLHGGRLTGTYAIMTPGRWKCAAISLPEALSNDLQEDRPGWRPRSWGPFGGSAWPLCVLYAPAAGEATDLYSTTAMGFVHLDMKTGKFTLIGNHKAGEGALSERPSDSGGKGTGLAYQDGTGDTARLTLHPGCGASFPKMDDVTGRIFWIQPVPDGRAHGCSTGLRSVEKLLRYKDKSDGPSAGSGQGKEYLLPAFLDAKDLYKKVKGPAGGELEPVMSGGIRAKPVFAVRTQKFPKVGDNDFLLGLRAPALTPDGKGIYWRPMGKHDTPDTALSPCETKFDDMTICDLETGKTRPLPPLVKNALPPCPGFRVPSGAGTHVGQCSGIDGFIYIALHGGCGSYPMQLLRFDPETGMPGVLYNSNWGKWERDAGTKLWDGPADSQYLKVTSTKWGIQCPRTGAILTSGWDSAGLRRYQDGFVTHVIAGQRWGGRPGPDWWTGDKNDEPQFASFNAMVAVAPNGDMYSPDHHRNREGRPLRVLHFYRTDWPKEQPEYGYGEKFMPRAKLEELMLEYARKYIANYDELSKVIQGSGEKGAVAAARE